MRRWCVLLGRPLADTEGNYRKPTNRRAGDSTVKAACCLPLCATTDSNLTESKRMTM